jgi:hypothetical protein
MIDVSVTPFSAAHALMTSLCAASSDLPPSRVTHT